MQYLQHEEECVKASLDTLEEAKKGPSTASYGWMEPLSTGPNKILLGTTQQTLQPSAVTNYQACPEFQNPRCFKHGQASMDKRLSRPVPYARQKPVSSGSATFLMRLTASAADGSTISSQNQAHYLMGEEHLLPLAFIFFDSESTAFEDIPLIEDALRRGFTGEQRL